MISPCDVFDPEYSRPFLRALLAVPAPVALLPQKELLAAGLQGRWHRWATTPTRMRWTLRMNVPRSSVFRVRQVLSPAPVALPQHPDAALFNRRWRVSRRFLRKVLASPELPASYWTNSRTPAVSYPVSASVRTIREARRSCGYFEDVPIFAGSARQLVLKTY
jgi:hypothetical protein